MSNPMQTLATHAPAVLDLPVSSAGETVSLRQSSDGGIASEPVAQYAGHKNAPELGSRIGKFVIERLLGQGGQAQAWLAHDPDLRRQVVIKLYHSARSPEEQEIVLREGRALAQVRHPAVAQCLGADRHGGVPYLIVEYVAGKTLSQSLREQRPTPSQAVEIVAKIAAGAAAIHQAGLLHRDLKPANVLVNDAGQPVIIDFGLAAATGTHDGDSISGTPAYMAPEQAQGDSHRFGPATDVFGLGAILFEMLTGRPPYQGDSSRGTWQKAIEGGVDPVESLAPQVAPKLAALCNRCLARDPRFRYDSASELQAALEQWLASQSQGHSIAWLWKLGRLRLRLSFGVSLAALLLAAIGWKLSQPGLAPSDVRHIAQSAPAPKLNADSAALSEPADTAHSLPMEKMAVVRVAPNDSPQTLDVKPRLLRGAESSAFRLQMDWDGNATSRSTGAPIEWSVAEPRSARFTASADCQLFIWHEIPNVAVTRLIPDDQVRTYRLHADTARQVTLQLPSPATFNSPVNPASKTDAVDTRLHILATNQESLVDRLLSNSTSQPDDLVRWRDTLRQFFRTSPKSEFFYEVLPIRIVPATP